MWIVEQRDPTGAWSIIRATVDEREDAENLARLYKDHNPKLRFRYCRADEDGEARSHLQGASFCAGGPPLDVGERSRRGMWRAAHD
jgi:hypothetical protein